MPSLSNIVDGYPEPVRMSSAVIKRLTEEQNVFFVVLDDDPTGTQSVADVPVVTGWSTADILWGVNEGKGLMYVMTNTRSLDPDEAGEVVREVVNNAVESLAETGRRPIFISRTDSTLRGHFPLDTDVIANALESHDCRIDGVVLVPAYPEAGRITVGSIHFARIGKEYVPVGETEFAKDATFGFHTSSLTDWVCEKTGGRASNAVHIGLDTLRSSPKDVSDVLMGLEGGEFVTADAVTEEDMRVLAGALITAENSGKKFVYRVGPPFVRARIGQMPHPPLSSEVINEVRSEELPARAVPGGLVVVGSHVGLTTSQLRDLEEEIAPTILELDVRKILSGDSRLVAELIGQALSSLEQGTTVIKTSRQRIAGANGTKSLEIARTVSRSVVDIVNGIVERVSPRFVLAKGGITSSDVATLGLQARHFTAVGPLLDGIVSLWVADDGPARGVPYVVFAGNVGSSGSLTEVVRKLEV